MAKRGANKELNHENWDHEEEEEEAGTFTMASADVLKTRDIKVARRRNPAPASTSTDGSGGSAFKSFSFGVNPSGSIGKLFSFGSNNPPPTSGASTSSSRQPSGLGGSSLSTSRGSPLKADSSESTGNKSTEPQRGESGNRDIGGGNDYSAEYSASLRELNESLLSWVTTHVNRNPYCILSPIFVDYNQYINELEEERKAKSSSFGCNSKDSKQNGVSKSPNAPATSRNPGFGLAAGCTSEPTPATAGFQSSLLGSSSLLTSVGKSFFGFGEAKPSGSGSLGAAAGATAALSTGTMAASTSSTAAATSTGTTSASSSPFSGVKFGSVGERGSLTFDAGTSSLSGTFKFGTSVPPSSTPFSFTMSSAPAVSFGLTAPQPATGSITSTTTTAANTAPPSIFSAGFFSKPAATTSGASGSAAPSLFPTFSGSMDGFKFGTSSIVFGKGPQAAGTSGTSDGDAQGNGEGEDEEYVPPEPEMNEIKEEGAFYTVRCKLFYMRPKKDSKDDSKNEWADKGVGNLHMKKCGDNNSKTQLIIRTDNASGIILLNIILPKDMPAKKMNPTSVSIVCVPNPPIEGDTDKGGAKMMLIKVKTEAMANELLKKINENIPK